MYPPTPPATNQNIINVQKPEEKNDKRRESNIKIKRYSDRHEKRESCNRESMSSVIKILEVHITQQNKINFVKENTELEKLVYREKHKEYVEERVNLSTNGFINKNINNYTKQKEKMNHLDLKTLRKKKVELSGLLSKIDYPTKSQLDCCCETQSIDDTVIKSGLKDYKIDLDDLRMQIVDEQKCFKCFRAGWRDCKKEAKRLLKDFEEMCYKQAIVEYGSSKEVTESYLASCLEQHAQRISLGTLTYCSDTSSFDPETCLFVSRSQLQRIEYRARSVALMNYFNWIEEKAEAFIRVTEEFHKSPDKDRI